MNCKLRALLAVALAVTISSVSSADDQLIAKQIIQRLQQQKQQLQLRSFNIGVQVDQGTVTMMGTVLQPDHAVIALDVARRVPGVKLVVNDLFVQPQARTAANTICAGVAPWRFASMAVRSCRTTWRLAVRSEKPWCTMPRCAHTSRTPWSQCRWA